MSSNKKNKDAGSKKPSVFERLGSKPASSSSVPEDYCKQWAHKGTCSYMNKCKFVDSHKSTKSSRETKKASRSPSFSPKKERDSSDKSRQPAKQLATSTKPGGRGTEPWDVQEQDADELLDELALERKLEMLQRELAKQEEQEHKCLKTKKPVVRKRGRSSSTSSSTTSSSSESTTDSSDSSSSSSSGSTSSSSPSSSDSDGEVKEKSPSKKRSKRKSMKRSRSSTSKNADRGKVRSKLKKVNKRSQGTSNAKEKSEKPPASKKMARGSPKRQHASTLSGKHQRRTESPVYTVPVHSRSPRTVQEPELSRDRGRLRRSPVEHADTKRKPLPAVPPLPSGAERRRTEAHQHSPLRSRSRERKIVSSGVSAGGSGSSKIEKSRHLEPGYLGRSRSPYRDAYVARELSPLHSAPYRSRGTADVPYDSRRGFSPPPKREERELYDRLRRNAVSPEHMRRLTGQPSRAYDGDWSAEQSKAIDWDPPEYRRRNRPLDDWCTGSVAGEAWKKAPFSPPFERSAAWSDAPPKPSRLDASDHKRERRNGDGRQSRESIRRTGDFAASSSPAPNVAKTAAVDQIYSPCVEKAPDVVNTEEAEELRPSSSALDVDDAETFSDFSDDVDEILNRELHDGSNSAKTEDDLIEPVDPLDAGEAEENSRSLSRTAGDVEVCKAIVDLVVTATEVERPSPKFVSPPASNSALESRSTDEDLLVGMDIEQISDEELEDEFNAATPIDALEVDWTSLACTGDKKVDSGTLKARQRWEGKAVLARLCVGVNKLSVPETRTPLFDCLALFRRALSARGDLALRRRLCNLPSRELSMEHVHVCEDDPVYRASADLMLKSRTVTN